MCPVTDPRWHLDGATCVDDMPRQGTAKEPRLRSFYLASKIRRRCTQPRSQGSKWRQAPLLNSDAERNPVGSRPKYT